MTIAELQSLLDSGQFHHAEYGYVGEFPEGLYIYRHNPDSDKGYSYAGEFSRVNRDPIFPAYLLLKSLGLAPSDEEMFGPDAVWLGEIRRALWSRAGGPSA